MIDKHATLKTRKLLTQVVIKQRASKLRELIQVSRSNQLNY